MGTSETSSPSSAEKLSTPSAARKSCPGAARLAVTVATTATATVYFHRLGRPGGRNALAGMLLSRFR